MLEVFDVCSANWRRETHSQLSRLVGIEHTRKEEEIERRKEKNKQIREKIFLRIRDRQQSSAPEASSGSMTESTPE